MSIMTEIDEKLVKLEEKDIEPSNIHLDYRSLCALCSEVGMTEPDKGEIINITYRGYPVTTPMYLAESKNKTIEIH